MDNKEKLMQLLYEGWRCPLNQRLPYAEGTIPCINCKYKDSDSCVDEHIADYLLNSGYVIVLPCKVGDTIYTIETHNGVRVITDRIIGKFILDNEKGLSWENIYGDYTDSLVNWGITAFPSKEEAEEKLKEMQSK